MMLNKAVLSLLLLFVSLSAKADLKYTRIISGSAKPQGMLTTSIRDGVTRVSIRQFCFAMGCGSLYQWAHHKAVIVNTREHISAIVSSITHLALVDGTVLEFEGSIISDPSEGFLLPIDLVSKLAPALRLGKVEDLKDESKQLVKRPVESSLRTIVIDPGHGGSDWGTGVDGIHEKDVAVIYSLRLRDEIKSEFPDLEVILTRENDRYVSLPDRARLANNRSAQFFISLHVNHAPNPKVEGVETYILSPDATDAEAKKVALLENDSWLKNANIHEAGDTVKKILVDMEQTKYIQYSASMAALIQQELAPLDKTNGLKNRGVKQAMFYVLSQVAMPSVLVEMGFLSSTGDRSRLMNVEFRDKFVKSIVTAIKRYREKMALNPS